MAESEIIRPDGTRYVTELLPGEVWAYIEGWGIVIAHPDRRPEVIDDCGIRQVEMNEIIAEYLTYEVIGEAAPKRTIRVQLPPVGWKSLFC